jgi:predicted Zn-dependent protease
MSADPPAEPTPASWRSGRLRRPLPARAVAALALAGSIGLQGPPPAAAQPQQTVEAAGVEIPRRSRAASLASSQALEKQAQAEYAQLLKVAASQRALAPPEHPQLTRLQAIAQRLIPHTDRFSERADDWRWEVNLIGSRQINAFVMPGGKIAFFTGIIDRLALTDDEVAMIMGHEMAHALLEHAAGRAGQQRLAQIATLGASVFSQILGYGDVGGQVASGAAQLTLLRFNRGDETEADLVGMDIAARAGFDPRASITLWQKMAAAARGQQQPQFLSTHPSHQARTQVILDALPKVMPLYAQASGQQLRSMPPYRSNFGQPVPWPPNARGAPAR